MIELTAEERNFLTNLLSGLSINPAQDNAAAVVAATQAILQKLKTPPAS